MVGTIVITTELEDWKMILGQDERFIDSERAHLADHPEALPELETWALDDFADLGVSVSCEETLCSIPNW
jgi:hypothetical protein